MSDSALEELISARGLRPATVGGTIPSSSGVMLLGAETRDASGNIIVPPTDAAIPPPPAPGTNALPTVPASTITGKELRVDIPGRQSAAPEQVSGVAPPSTDVIEKSRKIIGDIESGGRYDIVHPPTKRGDRALGKYGILESGLENDSLRFYGRKVDRKEFLATPEIQDTIFRNRFGELVQKYGPEGAARAWFAGEGGMNNPNAGDGNATVAQYAAKFTKAFNESGAPADLTAFIEKRGLKPANTIDGRQQIEGEPSKPFLRSPLERAAEVGELIREDAMTAGAFMAGTAEGAVEVPLGIGQATLPRGVMVPVEEQYRNLTSSINNLGDKHPVAYFAGKIVGSTGAILLGSRLLGAGATQLGLRAITPKLAEAVWRAMGPVGRTATIGAGLGATQYYKDGTENEDRFGFSARMFDATVGAAFGVGAGMVARGVHYAATQLSDLAFGRQFLPVLQQTAGDVARNTERPLREAIDYYKRAETQSSAKYGLTAASGRSFDGFPSGVGATQTGASEGFEQAIDKALAGSRAAGVETRRTVEGAAARARSLLGLDKERGRLAEWEAAQKLYTEQLAVFQKAAAAHPLAGAFQRNPGLQAQLQATGSLPLTPTPPAPFVPTPVSAAAYQQTRTMLNKAARSTRDNAAKTQIAMMTRELDTTAAATATEFGMTGPEFLRRAVSANKFYEETVSPLRRLFDGKMARDVEGRAAVALDGVTPAQFYDKIGRAIDSNDLALVRDLAKTLGPGGRDNMKMIAAARALDKVQDGEIGQAYKYIQQRQDVLRELLGRDEYTQLVGMGKVADDVVRRFTAGEGESRRRVFDWSHSFGPALSFYALFQGQYLKAAGIAAALPAYHFAMNVLEKIHTTPLMRPMIARAASMRPGSPELSTFVDQMERRLRRATVPVVQAASPSD